MNRLIKTIGLKSGRIGILICSLLSNGVFAERDVPLALSLKHLVSQPSGEGYIGVIEESISSGFVPLTEEGIRAFLDRRFQHRETHFSGYLFGVTPGLGLTSDFGDKKGLSYLTIPGYNEIHFDEMTVDSEGSIYLLGRATNPVFFKLSSKQGEASLALKQLNDSQKRNTKTFVAKFSPEGKLDSFKNEEAPGVFFVDTDSNPLVESTNSAIAVDGAGNIVLLIKESVGNGSEKLKLIAYSAEGTPMERFGSKGIQEVLLPDAHGLLKGATIGYQRLALKRSIGGTVGLLATYSIRKSKSPLTPRPWFFFMTEIDLASNRWNNLMQDIMLDEELTSGNEIYLDLFPDLKSMVALQVSKKPDLARKVLIYDIETLDPLTTELPQETTSSVPASSLDRPVQTNGNRALLTDVLVQKNIAVLVVNEFVPSGARINIVPHQNSLRVGELMAHVRECRDLFLSMGE